jgi:AraC-like DNA-binding protein
MAAAPVPLRGLNFQLIEAKLIWIQDRLLEKSCKTNAVTVEDIPVWFVREGRLVVRMGGEHLQVGAGHWVLPRQGQGSVHTMPNSRILSLRFRLRWPNGQEVYRRNRTLVLAAGKRPALSRAAKGLLRIISPGAFWFADRWTPASCVDFTAMLASFWHWLAAYSEVMEEHGLMHGPMDSASVSVLEARQALLDWELSRPFSRERLSRQVGVGVQTLTRHFLAQYGVTPRAFLEQRRQEWAQERLAHGEERIKSISAELGFASLAQFSNWFRLRNQISPREYCKLHRKSLDSKGAPFQK